jgi:hypothetical protein
LFHVRQELPIHLIARALKRCQCVCVDFLTDARNFFKALAASKQLDRLLDSLERPLRKDAPFAFEFPVSIPAERRSSLD